MARNIGPKRKRQRRFGMVKGQEIDRKRKTAYGVRMEEKQKAKFIYGLMERHLKKYVEKAVKSKEKADVFLIKQLEMRLDNVIYRLGFAKSREMARQLISHRHILVDGKKINIASYEIKPGQKIELSKDMQTNEKVLQATEKNKKNLLPGWIAREDFTGKILRKPEEVDLPKDIKTSLIIEFYS